MRDSKTIRVKICGMRDADNILQVAASMPDYMGFIFYPASPRFVGEDFRIPETLPAHIKRVGVFVDASTEAIIRLAGKHALDYVQLHGSEPVEQVRELQQQGIGVIKVFSVDDGFNFSRTTSYKPFVNFFLFDTKGKLHGGNARTFNWEILKQYDQEIPFFLSGGLTPDNVEAIGTLNGMNLQALDVNSGVEEAPGRKSQEKISTLFAALNKIKR